MTRPYRKQQIAGQVRAIVSKVIAFELNDPRIEPFTTVTRVEVTGDLLHATVYLSVPGGETAERRTMNALRHATGHIRGAVAVELNIRQCPDLRFLIDESLKRTREVLALLEENRRKFPAIFPPEEEEEGKEEEEEEADEEESESNASNDEGEEGDDEGE